MKEFIKEFIKDLGYQNFIIIVSIVGVILILLIIVYIWEKHNLKKLRNKEELSKEESIKEKPIKNETINLEEKKEEETSIPVEEVKEVASKIDSDVRVIEDEKPNEEVIEDNNPKEEFAQDVVYDEHVTTKEEAKAKLNEVAKKLVFEDSKEKDPVTYFEKEQEEMSIISYDELKKISSNVNDYNDILLKDNGDEPITITELYNKKGPSKPIMIEEPPREIVIEKPKEKVFENTKEEKEEKQAVQAKPKTGFKNSAVISPVFGIYDKIASKNNVKPNTRVTRQSKLSEELDDSEDFLEDLRSLKNKLNQ